MRERRIGEERREQRKAELKLVLLLGVDGEWQPGIAHRQREVAHARQQLLHQHRLLLRRVARMQRRELHREARAPLQRIVGPRRRRARPVTNGGDGVEIAKQIAVGVLGRARGLAEHVEGEAVPFMPLVLRRVQRVADALAEHELIAENAHRLAQCLADERLPAPPEQPLQQTREIAALALAPIDDLAGQHQAVGRGIDEQQLRVPEMPRPVAGADGAGDQPIRGVGVRNTKQRLGEAKEQHPFPARQPVFVQEGVRPRPIRDVLSAQPRRAAWQAAPPRAAALRCRRALAMSAVTSALSSGKQARGQRRRRRQALTGVMALGFCHVQSLNLGSADRHSGQAWNTV